MGAAVYAVLAFPLAVAVSVRLKRMSLPPPLAARSLQRVRRRRKIPLYLTDAAERRATVSPAANAAEDLDLESGKHDASPKTPARSD